MGVTVRLLGKDWESEEFFEKIDKNKMQAVSIYISKEVFRNLCQKCYFKRKLSVANSQLTFYIGSIKKMINVTEVINRVISADGFECYRLDSYITNSDLEYKNSKSKEDLGFDTLLIAETEIES